MGREYSQVGRVVKMMVKMLIQMFGHMLTSGIGLIRVKTGMQAHQAKGRVCYFVDSTLRPHFRPLADVAQAVTYSGHKGNHRIKFQGVLPIGITADLWGPVVGRRHDGYLMMRSSLNARLREAQADNPVQYYAYGDTAYAVLSHVKRGFKTAGLSKAQTMENDSISVEGVGVEHAFGKVCNLWEFLDHKRDLKRRQNPVGDLYLSTLDKYTHLQVR
ncbi:unnamed protein product [Discosporangium mesarthrocarpum]